MKYTVVGDLSVFIICTAILIGLKATYTTKSKRYYLVIIALMNLMGTCLASAVLHAFLLPNINRSNEIAIYITHNWIYISLIVEFTIFILYIFNLINYQNRIAKGAVVSLAGIFSIIELSSAFTRVGFYIEDGAVAENGKIDPYTIFYTLFVLITFAVIISKSDLVINRIYGAIFSVFVVSLIVTYIQACLKINSYTTLTYVLPIIVVVILFHCNSYNSNFGSVDRNALLSRINSLISEKKEFSMVHILIPGFHEIEYLPRVSEDFKQAIREINYKDYLFRYSEDTFVMIFDKNLKAQKVQEMFERLHNKYNKTHKVTIVDSNEYCTSLKDYMRLCDYNHNMNTVYKVKEQDLVKFNKTNVIKKELADIEAKKDLNDPRIKVYCQPILNISTKTFTTAESLMRLELDDLGLIYPDTFIPIAESEGRIHTLTMIILNKVCAFIEENQDIQRISVNFSMYELVKPNFYEDIISIITQYSFDKSKLGFEITESMEAEDFGLIKEVLTKFRSLGIKIYLDDFGTGYSNIEHITKLPIDIIKFDRSLVISSGKDQTSKYLVSSLSNMFNIIGYNVLYEGIEDDADQDRCIRMKAEYLQGYKYSKPIPIEQLNEFINKKYEKEVDLSTTRLQVPGNSRLDS